MGTKNGKVLFQLQNKKLLIGIVTQKNAFKYDQNIKMIYLAISMT